MSIVLSYIKLRIRILFMSKEGSREVMQAIFKVKLPVDHWFKLKLWVAYYKKVINEQLRIPPLASLAAAFVLLTQHSRDSAMASSNAPHSLAKLVRQARKARKVSCGVS